MKLKVVRMEEDIVTCELDGGGLIDIGKRWLNSNIKMGDVIEFEYETSKEE